MERSSLVARWIAVALLAVIAGLLFEIWQTALQARSDQGYSVNCGSDLNPCEVKVQNFPR